MRTIEISKASKSLAEYAGGLAGEVIIVTSRRKPIAALVPLNGIDDNEGLASNPRLLAILKRSYEQIRAGKILSQNQMRREFGIPKPRHARSRR